MVSKDFKRYLNELKRELEKQPNRPRKGELLERAKKIPLIWPKDEYPAGRSMPEQFKAALENWGGRVHLVGSDAEVVPTVAEIVQKAGARRVSRYLCPRLNQFDFEQGLASLGVEWVMPSAEDRAAASDFEKRRALRDRLAQIDVGVTDADYAVAHTGTLVFYHDAERNGLINLLPWTHIAVIRASQMVPTVEDLAKAIERDHQRDPLPANMIFLTGPSRSGDIDIRVGQGAAGPGQTHVVLIDHEEPSATAKK